jgi:hypothetical protein
MVTGRVDYNTMTEKKKTSKSKSTPALLRIPPTAELEELGSHFGVTNTQCSHIFAPSTCQNISGEKEGMSKVSHCRCQAAAEIIFFINV